MEIAFSNYKISLLDTTKYEEFFNLINSNRERLEGFFAGTVSKTKTLEDTKTYCEIIKQRIKDKNYFPYIITTNSNDFIGLVDVKNISWNIPKAELGYFIDASYEGKGIVSIAVGEVVDYLFETYKFKKLLCRIASKNVGSIHIAKKNGFELEGVIKSDYKTTKGEIVDLSYFGRVFF